jgi:hypothetical protein
VRAHPQAHPSGHPLDLLDHHTNQMRQHDLQTLKITWLEMISNPRSLNQPTLRVDHGEWGQVQIQIRVGGIKPPATRTSIVAETFGSKLRHRAVGVDGNLGRPQPYRLQR